MKSESCRHTDLEARPVVTQLDHFEKVYSPNICINFVLTFFFCFVTTVSKVYKLPNSLGSVLGL